MMAQVNGKYDLASLLDMDVDTMDQLAEDASDALEELFNELTEFDYSDCNRYWKDIDEEETNAILEKYVPRIFDEQGNPLVRNQKEGRNMADYDAAKEVLREMRDHYERMWQDLRAELRQGKKEGWDEEAIDDMRKDMKDAAIKRNLLDGILETIDERVSCKVNGVDYM